MRKLLLPVTYTLNITLSLTANPFINSIIELKIVPLKEGWIREYGVMTPKEISPAIQKYIDLAKELYSSDRNQT